MAQEQTDTQTPKAKFDATAMSRDELVASFVSTVDRTGLVGRGADRKAGPSVAFNVTKDEVMTAMSIAKGAMKEPDGRAGRHLPTVRTLVALAPSLAQPEYKFVETEGGKRVSQATGKVFGGAEALEFLNKSFGNTSTRLVHFDRAAVKEQVGKMNQADVMTTVSDFRTMMAESISRDEAKRAAKAPVKSSDKGMDR